MKHIPQRTISFSAKLRVIFFNTLSIIGSVFFLVGVVSLFFILRSVNFYGFQLSSDSPVTEGYIQSIGETNTRINEEHIYSYYYQFKLTDEYYEGVSYDTYQNLQPGDEVEVRYKADNPVVSKITGMDSNLVPIWLIPFFGIFFLIGSVILLFSIKIGLHKLKLLSYGQIVKGKLVDIKETNMTINDQPVYKMFFEYEFEGKKHTTTTTTNRPADLTDEKEEKMVILSDRPEKSVLIDSLPKSVRNYFN